MKKKWYKLSGDLIFRDKDGDDLLSKIFSRDQFEKRYAARSNVSVQFLHEHGRYAEPCECGEKICEGWQMKHKSLEEETE